MMMKEVLGSTEQYAGYRYDVGSYRDETRYAGQQDDAQLQDFFTRPLKVGEFLWGTGTTFYQQFNPWSLFFENPRVINRLSNYNLLRADLHVRFLITGNGFHYGRIMASYDPLGPLDEFRISRALIDQDAIQESQRPHVYLDPTTSQGGDIKCPFFWYNDALNIPNQDWRSMGDITMRSFGTLEHANAAVDQVTISVLVWAENVEMSIPTSAEPGAISPQAADEYGTSPISTPASVVARIAGKLVDMPMIGLYAKATELAASTVANVARLFGYSRPRVLQDTMPYIPRFGGNMASTNAGDNSLSLAVDNKQELTIDPRVVGLTAADEMDIAGIACRESYLTFFPWTRDSAPETTLFSINVTPMLFNRDPLDAIAMLPCALAAAPFQYWRCKMRYRFQIVASQYHKGRLRFVWDPYGFASNEFNVNYNHIVDIAAEKDFTIEVAWGSDQHFKLTGNIAGNNTLPFLLGTIGTAGSTSTNGVLRVLVLNELTVPNTDIPNDVRVNVFASACDLEVGAPENTELRGLQWFPDAAPGGQVTADPIIPNASDDYEQPVTWWQHLCKLLGTRPWSETDDTVISGDPIVPHADVGGDTEETSEPSKPVQDQAVRTMGTEIKVTDPTFHVFFGETIVSFRQLLKRFAHSESFVTTPSQVNQYVTQFTTSLPLYPGYAPDAIHSSDVQNYNFTNTTMINWLMPCYTGWKGSLRWKAILKGSAAQSAPRGMLSVTRFTPSIGYNFATLTMTNSPSQAIAAFQAQTIYEDTSQGHQCTPTGVNPSLEVEVPFYTSQRFGLTRERELLTFSRTQAPYLQWIVESYNSGAGTTFELVNKYVATGEDFSFHFFNSIPYMYEVNAPNPV